jgi:hypothetical protein
MHKPSHTGRVARRKQRLHGIDIDTLIFSVCEPCLQMGTRQVKYDVDFGNRHSLIGERGYIARHNLDAGA